MAYFNDGGPAFPVKQRVPKGMCDFTGNECETESEVTYRGITVRDYFAAKALAICPHNRHEIALCAEWAYQMADAMIAQSEKEVEDEVPVQAF